jgi:prolipoprotein diacylglyceryltransferase
MLPELQLGGIAVGTHDLFSIVGILAGLAIYYAELRRRHMLEERILFISLAVLLGGGIGARLLLSWEHLEAYDDLGSAPLTWVVEHSGKSLIGAIVGGWVAAEIAKRTFRYPRSTGDCYALALPVAVAIGRVGCFLSELPLGTPTAMPWGMTVPAEAAARFAWCPGCDGPMHPSMLYEIVFNIVAMAAVIRWRRRVPVPGDTLKLYLLAAFTFRFAVEFVRGNEPQVLGLSGPQLVLIPLTAMLAVHFVREWRKGVLRVPTPPRAPGGSGEPTLQGDGGRAAASEAASHVLAAATIRPLVGHRRP